MFTNIKEVKLDRDSHVKLRGIPIKIPMFEGIEWKLPRRNNFKSHWCDFHSFYEWLLSRVLRFVKSSSNTEFPDKYVASNALLVGYLLPKTDRHVLHVDSSALVSGDYREKFQEHFSQLCPGATSPLTLTGCFSLLVTGLLSNAAEQHKNPFSTHGKCNPDMQCPWGHRWSMGNVSQ